jgi:hypothetical protein
MATLPALNAASPLNLSDNSRLAFTATAGRVKPANRQQETEV